MKRYALTTLFFLLSSCNSSEELRIKKIGLSLGSVNIDTLNIINNSNVNSYSFSGSCSTDGQNVDYNIGGIIGTVLCSGGAWSVTGLDVSAIGDSTSISTSVTHQDDLGNTLSESTSVIKDTVAPTEPTLVSVADGTTIFVSAVTMTGACEDGSVVEISGAGLNSTVSGTCSGSTYSLGATVTNGNGAKAFSIKATDTAGNESTSLTGSYTYSSTASIAITSSPIINIANASSYTLSGTCTPDASNVIDLDVGGELASNIDCTAGAWSHSFDVSGATDSASLAITANYGAGPLASDTTTVLKDTIAPTGLTQVDFADSSVVTDRVISTVGGACETGAVVHVTGDIENDLGPFTFTCAASAWSLDIALSRADGAKNINFDQIDAAGNPQASSIDHTYTFNRRALVTHKIAAITEGTCFIHADTRVFCTGADYFGNSQIGQLGNGGTLTDNQYTPVEIDMSGVAEANTFLTIAGASNDTYCAVHTSGKIFCWGEGSDGQLGRGSTTDSDVPVEIDMGAHVEANDFVSVHMGYDDSVCAIHSTGQAFCWGENNFGMLGDGTSGTDRTTPVKVDMSGTSEANNFTHLDLGSSFTCGIQQSGRLYCWGRGADNRLGNGSSSDTLTPIEVDMSALGLYDNDFIQVGAHSRGACGLHSSGRVYCWGEGGSGQNGIGSNSDVTTPTEVDTSLLAEENDFTQISAKGDGVCATHTNSKAFCWGENYQGQLAVGDNSDRNTPTEVDTSFVAKANTFQHIIKGDTQVCALHTDNSFLCSGEIISGQLGTGDLDRAEEWAEVDMSDHAEVNDFQSVSGSRFTTCAIHAGGKVFCWGYGSGRTTGVSSLAVKPAPVEIDMSAHADNNNFSKISLFNGQVFAVHATSNKIYGWGFNGTDGALGLGTTTSYYATPEELDMSGHGESNTYSDVAAGEDGGCGIHTPSQQVFCWGNNDDGQIGDGTTIARLSPVKIDMSSTGDANTFTKISGSSGAFCGLHTNSKIYCWGSDYISRLGNGTSGDSSVPMEVDMTVFGGGAANTFTDLSMNMYGGCGVHTNGALYCWGSGVVGIAGGPQRSGPVQVDMSATGQTNDFIAVTDGGSHAFYRQGMCAIHISGELFCFGGLEYPHYFGGVTASDYHLPTEMDFSNLGLTNDIITGAWGWYYQCAIHNGGPGNQKLVCTGNNTSGQLGINAPFYHDELRLVVLP